MDINKVLMKAFQGQTVQCSKKEEVNLEDPSFSNIDPHLKVDESEDSFDDEGAFAQPGPRKVSRKPPAFHAIFRNIKAITSKVEHIKGFKFEFTTPISQRFMLHHSWVIPYSTNEGNPNEQGQKAMMGMMKPPVTSNYTLSTQYVGGSQQELMNSGPKYLLSARLDSSGSLDASYLRFFNKNWNLQFHSQFPAGSDVKMAQINADLNYETDDSITTFKYQTGAVGFGHVQTITNKLVFGFESIFGTLQNMTMFNYSGRYSANKTSALYFNYIAPQDQACFAYQLLINKQCRLVSELNYKLSEGTTNTVIAFRQRLQDSETIATVSSKGKISTALTLFGQAYSLKLCAVADYFKDSYKFGYGISIGQPQ
ncbi:hypothetical protein ABPG72_004691 [Tetrahymena utriculariae]